MTKVKHVLGLSGGKDSAALAIYMRETYPELEIDYFFTDTGKELPEVYDYLNDLEAFLGRKIHRLNDGKGFDYWLKEYNNFLPSGQQRWCTIQMKLVPFENWIKPFLNDGYEIVSYVGIRADEPSRDGYQSTNEKVVARLPFAEDGLVKQDILNILEHSGLGLPEYYKWRSRSGCTFCFYQRKIEWVRLMEEHPALFEEAKSYEQVLNSSNGEPNGDLDTKDKPVQEQYFWLGKGTPLTTLEDPVRIKQIKDNHAKRLARFKKRIRRNALIDSDAIIDTVNLDDIYDDVEGGGACTVCYK